jgi:hypothetical protein
LSPSGCSENFPPPRANAQQDERLREGAIIFRDLVGKLDVLNIECDKCGPRGRYRPDRLIEDSDIDAKLFDWSDEITAD